MTLKVHMMGPRSTKFPYKAEGSWYVKLNNKVHTYLKTRMLEKSETIEEALLGTIMEGIERMKAEIANEPIGPENTN